MTAITYRPLTFPALLALELPVLQWIVDELLPRGSLTLFSGREKGGKSLLMFSLAVCVAQGRGFLGRSVRAGPVLLVPAE
ncbi:MAG: hypothetical protein QOJ59_3620, partial [Thermomicrobiales bacterium]|nr:hypothetical protein [Thermomicrobiales bacterium]